MPESVATILIVDDEPEQRKLLAGFVAQRGFRAREAGSAEEALEIFDQHACDLVLLDVRLPGQTGLEALAEIRRRAPRLPVLMMTAYADLRQGVAAIKSGADDYLAKPLDLAELEVAIADALGSGANPAALEALPLLPPWLICESPAMKRVIRTVAVVAPAQVPVLILGDTGVGKEVVARLIHAWSARSAAPLTVSNCASLPEAIVESELFGHTKGAFTGAIQSRPGWFRAADGGTLFLDEVGELPLAIQPKLLRALETGEITPVGSEQTHPVDVRVIAATNRDLSAAVAAGQFREDLYYRLNVVEVQVPRLAERCDDIVPLANRFAQEQAGARVRLSPQAVRCLLTYAWPGNVRELRNAIHRACLLCRGDVILPDHLPAKVVASESPSAPASGQLSDLERAAIIAAVADCHGNRTQAARQLGISRRALIYKLQRIEAEKLVRTQDQAT